MTARRPLAAVCALLLVLAAVAALSAGRPTPAHAAPAVNDKLVPLQGAWWGDYVSSNAADVGPRETLSGRKFDIVKQYQDRNDTFPDAAETGLANGGRFLFYDWEVERIYGNDPANLCWSQIASGAADADIDRVATNLRNFGQKVFLSVGNEPDLKLGTCNAANRVFGSATNYINAMRRVHDRFIAAGATNVVWAMAYAGGNLTDVAAMYPGDAYVDWIGWDPYNWYGCNGHSLTWVELVDKVAPFYNWAQTNHPAKPLMLTEYGSNEPQQFTGDTHSKGRWFRNIPAAFASQRPALKALIYFDRDNRGSSGCWWSVNSSTDALNGWKTMGADPYFNQPHTTSPITYIGAGEGRQRRPGEQHPSGRPTRRPPYRPGHPRPLHVRP